ncbi:MAG TPA: nitroreductase family deazaflavin-dependent oxidoreductase [Dehalococcoidia bacterium]|nr:nitroreductase family deazaflavin-dependent oxidoreductase [Dehalococcoidia bacterium]
MQDYNQKIIEEFRANEGKVGGPFEGATMLLLTHRGRKTGTERTNPLVTMPDGGRYIIFASKGGAPEDPDWYRNIKANSDVTVEVGTDKFEAKAEEVTGDERDRLWRKNVSERPTFGEYEERTDRVIPVIAIIPRR